MEKKPAGVSVVSWVLIIYWGISLILAILMAANAHKIAQMQRELYGFSNSLMQYVVVMNFLAPVVNLTLGILMLKAVNWSRHVFLIFNAVILIIALILMPQKIVTIITMIIYLIFLYFLYNRSASAFFTAKNSTSPAQ
ncbi:MAG: hypothetical protein A3F10_03560 [Coxiella sp. RIFCSPHIGHO2_12_FULL_42_15]|nr:MAG: hypothetical protein A3F10_03560 [Coxiella sp. RIFCSPHIGHO2_12_FULL_42_15]